MASKLKVKIQIIKDNEVVAEEVIEVPKDKRLRMTLSGKVIKTTWKLIKSVEEK